MISSLNESYKIMWILLQFTKKVRYMNVVKHYEILNENDIWCILQLYNKQTKNKLNNNAHRLYQAKTTHTNSRKNNEYWERYGKKILLAIFDCVKIRIEIFKLTKANTNTIRRKI